jgi:6-phosphogluconate dehydrogenase
MPTGVALMAMSKPVGSLLPTRTVPADIASLHGKWTLLHIAEGRCEDNCQRALIVAAGQEFGWDLPLPAIAKVWRAGCIIRSSMLDDMARALDDDPARGLMLAPFFAQHLRGSTVGLRQVVAAGAAHGLPMPALAAGLSWFDMMRTGRGTANMIQAQRDFFGAHGFERVDMQGTGRHGPWGGHM